MRYSAASYDNYNAAVVLPDRIAGPEKSRPVILIRRQIKDFIKKIRRRDHGVYVSAGEAK